MAFAPHGTRTNRVEGRIFISDWVGPFNFEMRQQAHSQALEERKALMDSGPWGYIGVFHNSALAGPDYMASVRKANSDPERGRNRVAAAHVLAPGVEGYGLVEDLYRDMWAGAGHPYEIFEDLDSAKAWVQALIDQAG